jgi:hypothetical protein
MRRAVVGACGIAELRRLSQFSTAGEFAIRQISLSGVDTIRSVLRTLAKNLSSPSFESLIRLATKFAAPSSPTQVPLDLAKRAAMLRLRASIKRLKRLDALSGLS